MANPNAPQITALPNAYRGGALERAGYLQIVQAGLAADQPRFAREAVLRWLASYPGDLGAGFLYAQALIHEGRPAQALPVLAGLLRADPAALEVLDAFDQAAAVPLPASLRQPIYDPAARSAARLVLAGGASSGADPAAWGQPVRAAWLQLEKRDLPAAGQLLAGLFAGDVPHPLVGLMHLQCLSGSLDGSPVSAPAPLPERLAAVEVYARRWPDCLGFMLWQADWLMENSETTRAVALLHQAAARDVQGRVARRLWGAQHPYRSLWPDRLERVLDLPIPAEAAAVLGWNRLSSGSLLDTPVEPAAVPADLTNEPPEDNNRSDTVILAPQPTGPRPPDDNNRSDTNIRVPQPTGPKPPDDNNRSDTNIRVPQPTGPRPPDDNNRSDTNIRVPQPTGPQPPDDNNRSDTNIRVPKSVRTTAGPPVDDALLAGLTHPLEWALYPVQDEPVKAATSAPAVPIAKSVAAASSTGAARTAGAARTIGVASSTAAAAAAPEPAPRTSAKSLPRTEAQAISDALDRIALRLKRKSLTGQDGRFPVYVILSSRSRLQAVYGQQAASLVESAMDALCQAVRAGGGWDALLFLADASVCTLPLGMTPARPEDPWELKLALTDLDAALGKRGERIGALLIVGGPEIVPFHHLPNPMDDPDLEVPSDSPYAMRDNNYFVPEWPVGRLPGGAGGDARLILEALQRFRQAHLAHRRQPTLQHWWQRFAGCLAGWKNGGGRRSVGYTAARWRSASEQVFNQIGRPAALHLSPPSGAVTVGGAAPAVAGAGVTGVPSLAGRLGYFNLHGMRDASEWFGHRDPNLPFDGPDFPVALRPEDIQERAQRGALPQIVFSEACYGLRIQDRTVDQAISLKLLEAGSLAVVGSTCMAYGTFDPPLAAADLLGHIFWGNLKAGMPAGEALRQAKLSLAVQRLNDQDFLDGDDQKTLLSFNLYGDPLAHPVNLKNGVSPKCVRYRSKPLERVKTVCDRATASPSAPPARLMDSVEQVISRYLPQMGDATIVYASERENCSGGDHTCPTSQLKGQLGPADSAIPVAPDPSSGSVAKAGPGAFSRRHPARSLVTLSKKFMHPDGEHTEVARLTLDENGSLVKLVVSR